ncbi:hypothetical protein GXM_05558 [Nostoc sphaeroides CCNUC1]|uniref:Uncharacterized protein n=1 Tax=Nostoc sphaeroides CCNUC1 TaxID=2653204 RepID=A0A5P8W746_9NOSO|nr:hypothetical protein GXM_05558 [Nostoc sphaeroides CCNUC1]
MVSYNSFRQKWIEDVIPNDEQERTSYINFSSAGLVKI